MRNAAAWGIHHHAATAGIMQGNGAGLYDPYLVYDTFTDTNGTALASHTPEKGGAWSSPVVGLVIDGTRCDSNAAVTGRSIITAAADVWIRLYCTKFTAGDPAASQIVFNYLDANNYWTFGQYFNLVRLAKVVAGATTEVALGPPPSAWPASGTPVELKVNRNGNSITCYKDGVSLGGSFSASDAALKTATGIGINSFRNASDYWKFLTFTAALTDV